jgi:predicted GH43/DUF377 family glycosyl hydrolase
MPGTQPVIEIAPDHTRVIVRLFVPGHEDVGPGDSRAGAVLQRLLQLDEHDVEQSLLDVDRRFQQRHRDLHATFERHALEVSSHVDPDATVSLARRLLIGATFTHEYSIEGAALCNPSVVLLPDIDPDGGRTFVMSVRGIGEGHRSSIGFRTGRLAADGSVSLDPAGPFPTTTSALPGVHHRSVFHTHLHQLGDDHENAAFVLDALDEVFTTEALHERMAALQVERATRRNTVRTADHLGRLARSSYRLAFDPGTAISERVLWPQTPVESHGMEDARFVRFVDDDGRSTYYATYTAFDGTHIAQHLLETTDFREFEATPMAGVAARGKGLALFPRRIGGQFVALTRSDRESNEVAFSDDIRCWHESTSVQVPTRSWEVMQLGNCGSPIETERGWLVLTHGVGAMRTYSLGVILLDLDDPTKVLATSAQPIVTADERHRDGYVPNVVYTCGAVAVGDTLLLPYGCGDQTISVTTRSLSSLLDGLVPCT